MPQIMLTTAACHRLKAAPGARIDYFDKAVPGFALRVTGPTLRHPQGYKQFVSFFREHGRQRRYTWQPGFPELGLAAARDLARGLRGNRAEGIALPAAPLRPVDRVENVVAEFVKRYMEGRPHSPGYIEDARRIFDRHVLPVWGGRELGSITRREVVALLDAIVDSGKGSTANRAAGILSKLFNWAIRRDLVAASPVHLIEKPYPYIPRERVLSPSEIRLVWNAAETLGYPHGSYFRMLLATGQRRREVAGLQWDDLDLGERLWVSIPKQRKDGPVRRHLVPLSPLALAILDECPRRGPYAFATLPDRPLSGFTAAKRAIDLVLDGAIGERWTIHDLRRTCATGLARLRVQRFTIGRVLNHTDASVTGIYDLYDRLDEKRAALDAWAYWLEGLTRSTDAGLSAA
jgi:integrase